MIPPRFKRLKDAGASLCGTLRRLNNPKTIAAVVTYAASIIAHVAISAHRRRQEAKNPEPAPLAVPREAIKRNRSKKPTLWYESLPDVIIAVDVETTGLSKLDRVVSLGAVRIRTKALSQEIFDIDTLHLIFNPKKDNHPMARKAHGYSDAFLLAQPIFEDHAAEVSDFLNSSDLIIAHNASFDTGFINREFEAVNYLKLTPEIHCTMHHHRSIGAGPAGLDAISSNLGLARISSRHNALEDAWLTLMIHLSHCGCRLPPVPLSSLSPTNQVLL